MKHLAICLAFALAPWTACQDAAERADDLKTQSRTDGIEIVHAPAAGAVASLVATEIARRPGRRVLVYVSASWCEPCVHLEESVASGVLDTEFPGLELYKFDFDRDEERLAEAGYISDLIPLLVIPQPDGRASARRMEGSIKGSEAVATNLVPRLHTLLRQR